MTPPCTVEGCERPKTARGLCSGHYTRWRQGRTVDSPLATAFHDYARCRVEGCLKKAKGEGDLCRLHIGDPEAAVVRANARKPCRFDGCDRPSAARGLCKAHIAQHYRGEELRPTGQRRVPAPRPKRPCSFEGCTKPYYAKGWCTAHYMQVKRGQELHPLRDKVVRDKPVRRPRKPAKETPQDKPVEGASVLPAGWFDVKPKRKGKLQPGGSLNPEGIGFVATNDPETEAACLRLLAKHDALDLAEVLGLTEAA